MSEWEYLEKIEKLEAEVERLTGVITDMEIQQRADETNAGEEIQRLRARLAELEGWLWKVVKATPIEDNVATPGYSWKEPALYKLLKGMGAAPPAAPAPLPSGGMIPELCYTCKHDHSEKGCPTFTPVYGVVKCEGFSPYVEKAAPNAPSGKRPSVQQVSLSSDRERAGDGKAADLTYHPEWNERGPITLSTDLNVSCITCKHGPRRPGKLVDSCGKYGMADQCHDHGFGGYEAKGGDD